MIAPGSRVVSPIYPGQVFVVVRRTGGEESMFGHRYWQCVCPEAPGRLYTFRSEEICGVESSSRPESV